jgi:hypothetical protein
MKADQWILLYEKEHSLRLHAQKTCKFLLFEVKMWFSMYMDLHDYLIAGNIPCVMEFNGVTSLYLIS